MTQSYYDPNQQQYQSQPQPGYFQQPPQYQGQPWPGYSQQPPQIQRSDTGKSMAIIAIICFAVAWISGIASLIPFIGYAFLCFALIVHLLGFIFLAIAISKWPRQ